MAADALTYIDYRGNSLHGNGCHRWQRIPQLATDATARTAPGTATDCHAFLAYVVPRSAMDALPSMIAAAMAMDAMATDAMGGHAC